MSNKCLHCGKDRGKNKVFCSNECRLSHFGKPKKKSRLFSPTLKQFCIAIIASLIVIYLLVPNISYLIDQWAGPEITVTQPPHLTKVFNDSAIAFELLNSGGIDFSRVSVHLEYSCYFPGVPYSEFKSEGSAYPPTSSLRKGEVKTIYYTDENIVSVVSKGESCIDAAYIKYVRDLNWNVEGFEVYEYTPTSSGGFINKYMVPLDDLPINFVYCVRCDLELTVTGDENYVTTFQQKDLLLGVLKGSINPELSPSITFVGIAAINPHSPLCKSDTCARDLCYKINEFYPSFTCQEEEHTFDNCVPTDIGRYNVVCRNPS